MVPNVFDPMPWSKEQPDEKVEQPNEEKVNPDRVGIFMNDLERIITYLNESEELQAVFGVPVSRALVIVADNNDLRIEEGGQIPLRDEQTQTFLRVLNDAIMGCMGQQESGP